MHLDHQVLFIHNPRASGTSIRRSLLMGRDPNVTAQWPEHLGKHAFASQLKPTIPEEIWNSRFRFAVVRNPWERMVSLYGLFRRPSEDNFKRRSQHAKLPMKLGKFLDSLINNPAYGSKNQNRVLAQRALNLRFLDWVKFCDKFGWQACRYLGDTPMTQIPQCRWFDGLHKVFRFEDREEIDDFLRARGYPRAGTDNTTKHSPWQSYYDDETYALVAERFKEDIERFGYD